MNSVDVPQISRGEVETTLSVGKDADNLHPAPDFLHDAQDRIVRPDTDLLAVREITEGPRLADVIYNQFRRPSDLLAMQLGDNGVGLLLGRRATFLGMDSSPYPSPPGYQPTTSRLEHPPPNCPGADSAQ